MTMRLTRKPALLKVAIVVNEYEKFTDLSHDKAYIPFGDRQVKHMPRNHFRYSPEMEDWLTRKEVNFEVEYDE